jgi:hypothetical protein
MRRVVLHFKSAIYIKNKITIKKNTLYKNLKNGILLRIIEKNISNETYGVILEDVEFTTSHEMTSV